jgi:hypothetical protein
MNADNAPALYEPGAVTPLTVKRDDKGSIESISLHGQLNTRVTE